MPIGRGIMIKQRFTVFQTATTIISKMPGIPFCNENVAYNITVTPAIVPNGGTVQLINTFDNSVLASNTLTAGATTINYAYSNNLFGSFQVVARYLGVNGNPDGYSSSQSIIDLITVLSAPSIVTIGTIPSHVCFGNDYTITATVTSTISANNPITDGYVAFIGDNLGTPFIIATDVPVIAGVATGTVDGYDGYVMVWPNVTRPVTFPVYAAFFPGSSCFAQANSPIVNITVDGYATTTVISPISSFSRTAGGTVSITATVTSAQPGTVNGNLLFESLLGPITLGNAALSAGVATITPLKSAFSVGDQLVTAKFFGDFLSGDCYEPSSDGYLITVTA